MSDLYRNAMNARLAKLPATLPGDDGDEEEEETDGLGALPGQGLGPPAMFLNDAAHRPRLTPKTRTKKAPNPEYTPISAATYFEQALMVEVPERGLDFRVYYTPPKTADGAVMVCHHGAGYSGLSFACMAQEIVTMTKGECGVLSVDARRHGRTTAMESHDDSDLSEVSLVQDFAALVKTFFKDPATAPVLILVGHSMGGSVVVRACPLILESKFHVAGVAVLDIVEGSALDALPHMNSILNARPDGFDSPEEAIEWHLNTKAIRNPLSARVSVPNIIKPSDSTSPLVPAYVWRTPLRLTAPFWRSWFEGLSANFLICRTARLLVLAGTDRLDKELMIGQMQGKFQLIVIPSVGHLLHEDDPRGTAETLVEFWRRNERIKLPIKVKKVGEL
ncbi:protein phosphatase methylesterase [Cylindrobasidium torrendii FP15055 ss-10]|uniref:Protein phosphatase methylesterase 1 n=1 Tax=Cylindrobasidium torrendii FP15055 ss-10 TaxID=1314674 RepID=A0A0D7AZE0_9AGAR|nr:protein phosphatase methylesterase [Cylindrobasidium torrendii FP15055 ss-10]